MKKSLLTKIKCLFGLHSIRVVTVSNENLYCCNNCRYVAMMAVGLDKQLHIKNVSRMITPGFPIVDKFLRSYEVGYTIDKVCKRW